MKDLNKIINESIDINEDYDSFERDLRKNNVPDEVILALYDNRSRDRMVSERMLCAAIKAMYKNKK
jgi:hypothetical protein